MTVITLDFETYFECKLAEKLGEKCDQSMRIDFDTVWPIILQGMGEYRDAKTA